MAIKFLSDTTHEKGDIHLDGTSSERLDLDSGVKITGQYNANGGTEYTYINMYNGGDASINIGTKHSLGYISFESGNGAYTERMRITNNGNVGIGTTSPNEKLHVAGNIRVANSGKLYLWNDHNVNFLDYKEWQTSSTSGMTIENQASGGHIKLVSNGNINLYANNNGNVGIGTTSPGASLHVASTTSDFVAKFSHTTATGYAPGSILLQAGQGTSRGQGLFHYNTEADESWFTGVPYNVASRKWIVANKPSTTFNPDVAQLSHALFTIEDDGNVGIGTTSPSHKLQVAGNIYANAGQIYIDNGYYLSGGDATSRVYLGNDGSQGVQIYTDSTERMRIADGGNVGIGTTSPALPLHVDGNARITNLLLGDSSVLNTPTVPLFIKSSGTNARMRIEDSDGDNLYYDFYVNQGAGFYLNEGTTTRMFISSSGNVGIGTTSPAYKLDVNGSFKAQGSDQFTYLEVTGQDINIIANSDVRIGDNSTDSVTIGAATGETRPTTIKGGPIYFQTTGANRMFIAQDGNVGIGTTSPSAKLHVAGAIKTTGDVTMSSNTTLHIGNVDLTTGSGGNTVSVEAASSSNTAMNFKTSGGTTAVFMVYQGTTTTRFAGRVEPSGNRTLDLGTDALRWQVVYCETLDSAGQHESNLQNPEGEKSVGDYATGTVLVWKGGKNIPCTEAADHMRMGIAVNGTKSPLVQGAEPVLVSGAVSEGDYLVTSSIEGHAKAISPQFMRQHGLYDCVIGKALESGEGKSYLIKTWINI